MDLVGQILKGLADDRKLDAKSKQKTPLKDLIVGYGKVAVIDDNVPELSDESTGLDLKNGLRVMDAEKQVHLLFKYSESTRSLDNPFIYQEDPEKVEQRKRRTWLIKLVGSISAFMVCVIVGAVAIVGIRAGVFDNAIVSTIMNTATEIIKVLFTG